VSKNRRCQQPVSKQIGRQQRGKGDVHSQCRRKGDVNSQCRRKGNANSQCRRKGVSITCAHVEQARTWRHFLWKGAPGPDQEFYKNLMQGIPLNNLVPAGLPQKALYRCLTDACFDDFWPLGLQGRAIFLISGPPKEEQTETGPRPLQDFPFRSGSPKCSLPIAYR